MSGQRISIAPFQRRNTGAHLCDVAGVLTAGGITACDILVKSQRPFGSATKSGPPRKPPALGRHFYLFTFFDKERNTDLKTGLQRGWRPVLRSVFLSLSKKVKR